MNKFILTHTNGMVTIKIEADVMVNSKDQRVIESLCKNACNKIADYIDSLIIKEEDKNDCSGSQPL